MKRSQAMRPVPQAAPELLWRCVCFQKRPENILLLWKNGFHRGHLCGWDSSEGKLVPSMMDLDGAASREEKMRPFV